MKIIQIVTFQNMIPVTDDGITIAKHECVVRS